jgi:phenylacetic acid degradation operon negative regulatory protein
MSYLYRAMATALGIPAGIAARLQGAPTTDFVYSSLSFLRACFGAEVPGTWFVAAIGDIGVDPQTMRQTLFRMVRSGVLVARQSGRVKWYRPAGATSAILDAGGARTRETVDDTWDERWTLVHLRLEEDRQSRDRLRDVLLVHGFGRLRPGVYIHPRDKTQLVLDAATDIGAASRVAVFRGIRYGAPRDADLVRQLWDLPALESRYRNFVRRYEPVATAKNWAPRQAFALRFAYMFELFRITWDDPSLPARFLSAGWAGRQAREIGQELRERLRPGALEFAEQIAERVGWRDRVLRS